MKSYLFPLLELTVEVTDGRGTCGDALILSISLGTPISETLFENEFMR